jgi:anti-sigma factor RsiW
MTNIMTCEQIERMLDARLDGTLDAADRRAMDAHLTRCDSCRALVGDVDRIVADARSLPLLTPSRDLWSAVEARLGAQDNPFAPEGATVQSLSAFRDPRLRRVFRTPSLPQLAAAAVLLVAVTAGVTWNLASRGSDSPAATVADVTAPQGNVQPAPVETNSYTLPDSPMVAGTRGRPAPSGRSAADVAADREWVLASRYMANSDADVEAIYEREIAALRTIVDDRFAELDSVTVVELRRNLDIIDKAIADSRSALLRDPRSPLLSRQLDRALEHKLDVLRWVASL